MYLMGVQGNGGSRLGSAAIRNEKPRSWDALVLSERIRLRLKGASSLRTGCGNGRLPRPVGIFFCVFPVVAALLFIRSPWR